MLQWHGNKFVLLMRQAKGLTSKRPVSCTNIIKLYNDAMGVVDIMDQSTAAYRLDRKSKYRFYLSMFLHLSKYRTCKQSYCLDDNDISLTNFKTVLAKSLIGRYSNRKRSFPTSMPRKRKSHEPSMSTEVPIKVPEF